MRAFGTRHRSVTLSVAGTRSGPSVMFLAQQIVTHVMSTGQEASRVPTSDMQTVPTYVSPGDEPTGNHMF